MASASAIAEHPRRTARGPISTSGRVSHADLSMKLIIGGLLLAPYGFLSRPIGGSALSLSVLLLGLGAGLTALNLLAGRIRIRGDSHAIPLWLMPFLFVALLSWIRSPFGLGNAKAAVQIAGLLVSILAMVNLASAYRFRPKAYFGFVNLMLTSLAALGGLAIVEFLLNNLFRTNLVDFSFLNVISGETLIIGGTRIGDIWRSTTLANEPSHLGLYLAVGVGPSVMRLGLLGRRLSAAIAPMVQWWQAALILGGLAVTLSAVGYLAAIAAMAATALFNPNVRFGRSVTYLAIIFLVFGGGLVALIRSESVLVEKLVTLSLVAEAAQGRAVNKVDTEDVTALAIATNFYIMQENVSRWPILGAGIGSHPLAFKSWSMSLFKGVRPDLLRLNSQDAASLAIRLLSETGFLGLLAFLGFVVATAATVRKAVIGHVTHARNDRRFIAIAAISTGLAASAMGVTAASLARMGFYYGGPVWVAFAIVAPLPMLYRSSKKIPR